MLKKKQSSNNNDWVKAYKNIEEIIPRSHIEKLTINTLKRIKKNIDEKQYKRVGYAWSGGKDSIVLHDLLMKSGIDLYGGMIAIYEHEFPAFLEWIEKNKPSDVKVYRTYAFTDDYINKNPEILFPMETKYKDAYLPPRWKAQNQFTKEHGIDCLILGRRTLDGNRCGNNSNCYTTRSNDCDKFNPIADWNHEEILAYLHYNHLQLPPIYFYENGFQGGTQLWTEKRRINGSYFETFDLLMGIDPRIIEQSKGKIHLVDEYLEYKKNGGTKK